MLIIRQIFHISTRYFSRLFSICLCLISQPFVASPFFGCARGVFYRHTISPSTFSSRLLLIYCFFFGVGMCLTSWFFCSVPFFFDFRRLIARLPFVCVVFPCWLLINIFPSRLPRCRRSVPMFFNCFFNVSCETLLFSLWFIAFSPFVFYSIQGDVLWFLLPCFSDSCVLSHGFMRLARQLSSIGIYRSSMSWHNFLAMPDRNNTNRHTMLRFYLLPLIF